MQMLACLRWYFAVSEWACLTEAMRPEIIRMPKKQLDQPGLTSKLPDLLQPECVQLSYNTVCHNASPSVKLSLTARSRHTASHSADQHSFRVALPLRHKAIEQNQANDGRAKARYR